MKDLRAKYGLYAVVTGASSGIGEEFARQLAAAGVNVVMVARRKDRLETLAAELTGRHGTENRVVALDLLDAGAVDELCRQVADLDVGIVVANAGISLAGRLIDNPLAREVDVLMLDGVVPLQLAHCFGRSFAQRRRGAIVLVSSTAGAGAVPYMANYAAVKGYVLSLGLALNYELKKDGVDVLVLSPGATATEGADNTPGIDFRKINASMMSPSKVVQEALDGLGKRAHVTPGGANKIMDFLTKHVMPRSLSTKLYGSLFGRALEDGSGSAA